MTVRFQGAAHLGCAGVDCIAELRRAVGHLLLDPLCGLVDHIIDLQGTIRRSLVLKRRACEVV
jgi:hypothetical protein